MVINGIDRIGSFGELFQGRRLGMVTSVSAAARDLRPGYIAFHQMFPLSCLFSPEHGLRGNFGNWEDVREDPVDPDTGAAVVSLFGDWTAQRIPGSSGRGWWCFTRPAGLPDPTLASFPVAMSGKGSFRPRTGCWKAGSGTAKYSMKERKNIIFTHNQGGSS